MEHDRKYGDDRSGLGHVGCLKQVRRKAVPFVFSIMYKLHSNTYRYAKNVSKSKKFQQNDNF